MEEMMVLTAPMIRRVETTTSGIVGMLPMPLGAGS
jgi:hypothetical protein